MVAIVFLGFAGLVLGLISIIYPLRFIGIRSRAMAFWLVIVAVAVIVFAGDRLAPKVDPPNSPVIADTLQMRPQPTALPPSQLQVPTQPKPSLALPPDQGRLVAAVARGIQRYRLAENDMQRGAARPARAKDICAALTGLSVNGWTGKISELSTNGEGRGVLSIKISDEITIGTTNNSFSDAMYSSLIDPNGELFAAASRMKIGDNVIFSGRFFKGDTDCIAETSLTLRGSIMSPDFLIRFTNVSRSP